MSKDLELDNNGTTFPVYLAEPESGEVKGAIIVIHEVWGLTDHIKSIADRFAAEGYIALAPNLFSDTDLEEYLSDEMARDLFNPEKRSAVQPKLREIMAPIHVPEFANSAKAKLKQCYDYIAQNPKVSAKIAVIGFCFGGTYSFQTAMLEPNLKAAIPFYGHADFSIDQLSNIKCPVLAFYGENDHNLVDGLSELKSKMSEAHVNFESIVYPDCGHAFFNDSNPYAYNEAAAKDAWPKVLEFLSSHLN
jgi:carboxymethylenebutenolidase